MILCNISLGIKIHLPFATYASKLKEKLSNCTPRGLELKQFKADKILFEIDAANEGIRYICMSYPETLAFTGILIRSVTT